METAFLVPTFPSALDNHTFLVVSVLAAFVTSNKQTNKTHLFKHVSYSIKFLLLLL